MQTDIVRVVHLTGITHDGPGVSSLQSRAKQMLPVKVQMYVQEHHTLTVHTHIWMHVYIFTGGLTVLFSFNSTNMHCLFTVVSHCTHTHTHTHTHLKRLY